MRVIEYSYPQKTNTKDLAVALGYFDGVHLGHRKLLSVLTKEAKEKGLTPCVFTFAENPSKTKKTQSTLYNNQDKISILEEIGIEILILASFDSIRSLTPNDFVEKVLIEALSAQICVVGYNFRFGYKAMGDANMLSEIMIKNNKSALIVDEHTVKGKTVSSTEIRRLIERGAIEDANALLGLPYFLEGRVERGLGLGRSFGFPTINTPVRDGSPLQNGVYRSAVRIDGLLFTGITNIGRCPTVEKREVHAETLIANFDGDLYGKEVRIYLLEYLREEKQFTSVDELREQIYKDRDLSIEKNGDLKWLATGLNSL